MKKFISPSKWTTNTRQEESPPQQVPENDDSNSSSGNNIELDEVICSYLSDHLDYFTKTLRFQRVKLSVIEKMFLERQKELKEKYNGSDESFRNDKECKDIIINYVQQISILKKLNSYIMAMVLDLFSEGLGEEDDSSPKKSPQPEEPAKADHKDIFFQIGIAKASVTSICMSPDGSAAVIGDSEGTLSYLSVSSNTIEHKFTLVGRHSTSIQKMCFSRNSTLMLSCCSERLNLWRVEPEKLTILQKIERTNDTAVSPDLLTFCLNDTGLILADRTFWFYDLSRSPGSITISSTQLSDEFAIQSIDLEGKLLLGVNSSRYLSILKLRIQEDSSQSPTTCMITELKRVTASSNPSETVSWAEFGLNSRFIFGKLTFSVKIWKAENLLCIRSIRIPMFSTIALSKQKMKFFQMIQNQGLQVRSLLNPLRSCQLLSIRDIQMFSFDGSNNFLCVSQDKLQLQICHY